MFAGGNDIPSKTRRRFLTRECRLSQQTRYGEAQLSHAVFSTTLLDAPEARTVKKIVLAAAVVASILLPTSGYAKSQLPGSELWLICKDGVSTGFYGPACIMYIAGVWDALWMINREQTAQGDGGWCIPEQAEAIGLMKLADIVALYLRDNPKLRDYSAGALVVEAIKDELC